MSSNLPVPGKAAASPPNLTESLRRSLADPFHLGDEIPKWEPPAALPRPEALRVGIAELERSLKPAAAAHQQWCVGKLFVLPTRDGTATKAAMQADNFIDACGHFPDDLWSAGTLELLQTKTFRPSPAELFEAINGKYQQRQRMLQRAKVMLNGPTAEPAPAEKPIETRIGRLEHTRTIYQRMGRRLDIERMDREIAKERGEPVPARTDIEIPDAEERPPFAPSTSPSSVRCAELAAAHRTGKPAPEYRDVPEVA